MCVFVCVVVVVEGSRCPAAELKKTCYFHLHRLMKVTLIACSSPTGKRAPAPKPGPLPIGQYFHHQKFEAFASLHPANLGAITSFLCHGIRKTIGETGRSGPLISPK